MDELASLGRRLAGLDWRAVPQSLSLAGPWLSEWLYSHYFINWRGPEEHRTEFSGAPWFVAELEARCAGATTAERGFVVTRRHGAGAMVDNGTLTLWVEGQPGRVGQQVAVRMPCARPGAIPGFFTLISRRGRLFGAAHLKFYVNATPAGALRLFEGLAHDPRLARVRFEAKTANDPKHFARRDSMLIYCDLRHARSMKAWVRGFLRRDPAAVRAGTPPLTQLVTRGVSTGVSSLQTDESYGTHRSRLVAEALLTARRERSDWRVQVRQRFEREGLGARSGSRDAKLWVTPASRPPSSRRRPRR